MASRAQALETELRRKEEELRAVRRELRAACATLEAKYIGFTIEIFNSYLYIYISKSMI